MTDENDETRRYFIGGYDKFNLLNEDLKALVEKKYFDELGLKKDDDIDGYTISILSAMLSAAIYKAVMEIWVEQEGNREIDRDDYEKLAEICIYTCERALSAIPNNILKILGENSENNEETSIH